MKRMVVFAVSAIAIAAHALAQPPAQAPSTPGGVLVRLAQNSWANAKRNIVESAQQMPAANYGFRPVDTVRTFGEILAHVAGANYVYCSAAKGEKSPFDEDQFVKTATTKPAIDKALADSVAYCDGAYSALTEAAAVQMIKAPFGSNQVARVQPLMSNVAHNVEHYGNLVTYFRIKGMVPPSSKREGGL